MAVTSFTVLAGGSLAEGFLAYRTDSLSSITKHARADTTCEAGETEKAGWTAASRRTTTNTDIPDRFNTAPEITIDNMAASNTGTVPALQARNEPRVSGLV